MHKDSGSEDADSGSVSVPQPSSTQAAEEKARSAKYVIPHKRGAAGQGLNTFLQRRSIPRASPKGRCLLQRPGSAREDEGVAASSDHPSTLVSGETLGLIPTPPRQNYSYAPTSAAAAATSGVADSARGWWGPQQKRADEQQECDEEYPALPGALPSSASNQFAVGGFMRGGHNQSLPTSSPSPAHSACPSANQPSSFRIVKEDGTCKTFFRKKPFSASDSLVLADNLIGRGASPYSSRLLSDNRLLGEGSRSSSAYSQWGYAAREAFFKPYETFFVDTHCHLDFLFHREPFS
jgi:hypothetical protein